jgi:hypothetical protein
MQKLSPLIRNFHALLSLRGIYLTRKIGAVIADYSDIAARKTAQIPAI